MHTVTAGGSPTSVGRAHGEQVASAIHAGLAAWRTEAGRHHRDADALIEEIFTQTGFRAAAEQWLPDLVEEVDGIAHAAGISRAEAFAHNCMDEAWWMSEGAGCSVIAVADERSDSPVIGQNMDLDTWMDASQTVLRLQPDDRPAQVVLSRAGMLGLCGANSAGLAVMVNTLAQLPVDRDGVPVAFVLRGLLSQPSLDAAVDVLHRLPHASGQAYTLATADAMRGFECGAGVVAEYVNDDRLPLHRWHTNHPIAQAALEAALAATKGEDEDDWATTSTVPRMGHLDDKVGAVSGRSDLQRMLSDSTAGICMYPGRWRDDGFTFGSIVVTLPRAGGLPVVEIAGGPPDRTDYETITFP